MEQQRQRKSWLVTNFPVEIKNRIIAEAKINNLTTPAHLENILIKHLDKQKQKQQKEERGKRKSVDVS